MPTKSFWQLLSEMPEVGNDFLFERESHRPPEARELKGVLKSRAETPH